MIDYLVLSTEITIYEALDIKEKMALEVYNKAEAYTKEYKSKGITKLGIWIDLDSILEEPNVKNCTLNVTVNARQFCKSGSLDAEKVLNTLAEILVNIETQDVIWRVQNISFAYTLQGSYAKEYIGLLNGGKSMSGIGIRKEVDNSKSPRRLEYISKGMRLKFSYDKNTDSLAISLWLLKQKVGTLAERYGIKKREFISYAKCMKELEWYLWCDYLKRISGMEAYYSFKHAESIIDATDGSKAEKENMKNVLKGVAAYKGVENYMSHVTDANPPYEFMKSIHTVDTARKYISLLAKAGINPVVLSRRYAQENNIHYIPNLITVLEGQDITRYRIVRVKSNTQNTDLREDNLPFD